VALIQARTQLKNRVVKVLEDTNIKLASVVSDLFGRSGRRMLAALVAGEHDPKTDLRHGSCASISFARYRTGKVCMAASYASATSDNASSR
jgi:hypothetical protein